MQKIENNYPNITWPQFAVCNDNVTGAFEDMARRLFTLEFLEQGQIPHSNPNNPGVEVEPILEAPHADGAKRRRISFQAKYFDTRVNYSDIKASMKKAVQDYSGQLDLIYLFCNKAVKITAKNYIETVDILKKANIELHLISDKEVLDLVSKYKEVARYFFLPRKRPEEATPYSVHTDIVINSGYMENGCPACPIQTKDQIMDAGLLRSLVQEKIQTCRSFILEIKFDKLREEIEKIFAYRLTGIEGAETLAFYKFIVELNNGNPVEDSIKELTEQYKKEALWLESYFKNPVQLSAYSFASHRAESQVLVLNKMFAAQLWDSVVMLCKEIVEDINPDIEETVKIYYGLALFNLQKYSPAVEILKALYSKSKKEHILLYSIWAEMKSINCAWREGNHESKDRLAELIAQLDSLKETRQYKDNENMVALLYLETEFNLSRYGKEYVENAVARYQDFSENVKKDPHVRYIYALCLEANDNRDLAEEVYAGLDWQKDENVACEYLVCMLARSDYAGVIRTYKSIQLPVIDTKIKSLYLSALFASGNTEYENTLKDFITEEQDDFSGIIDIAFGIEEEQYLQKYIIPLFRKFIDDGLEKLNFLQKTQLLIILSQVGELSLVLEVAKNVSELGGLYLNVIKAIYDAAFSVCNREFEKHSERYVECKELEASEQIAELFLEADVERAHFLHIKYLCAGAKGKSFSMLKYARELFEATNGEIWARNVIVLLLERNETNFDSYVPYINALRESKEPQYCMTLAWALLRLGKMEEADLYAYKALYFLDETEDYNIYKSFFEYYYQSLNRYQEEKIERVKGNCVVTLEEILPEDDQKPEIIIICLDSEREFSDINNKSLGIRHIPASDPLYLKIYGSGLKETLKIKDRNYQTKDICSRNSYAIGFIFRKVSQYPEKFNGSLLTINTNNPEEMVEKLKEITDQSERTEILLKLYHFEETETGIPIDLFINGNYDRYIDIVMWLLHAKDQAFYTGYPVEEKEEGLKYVPTLSTLVLLSSMNLLKVLDVVKDHLLLPMSYKNFFAERYKKAKERNLASSESLINVNNQLALMKEDSFKMEIWERILDFCSECKMIEISEEERIEFTIRDEINGEQFFSLSHLLEIHLDSFILASKEQATLLCDDLFFRKIASYGNIKNNNSVSLLQHCVDDDFVMQILMELSKTNYLCAPFWGRTPEERIELANNMLQGERKSQYYSEMLFGHFFGSENE